MKVVRRTSMAIQNRKSPIDNCLRRRWLLLALLLLPLLASLLLLLLPMVVSEEPMPVSSTSRVACQLAPFCVASVCLVNCQAG